MVEYTDAAGNTFELPKLTTKLMAEMGKVVNSSDIVETVKAKYNFVKSCLPSDYLAQVLDGKKVDDIDLVELAKVYSAISNAYSAPMFEANTNATIEQVGKLKEAVDTVNSMANITAANKANRQVFKLI